MMVGEVSFLTFGDAVDVDPSGMRWSMYERRGSSVS